jgi:AhpD family alkylhydroperoxidase
MYDSKHVKRLAQFEKLAPDAWKAFVDFDKAAFVDGALNTKTKELIAVGVALSTQCPYCIEIHVKKAKRAGATDAELAEAALVSAALRAGGAVTHATHFLSDG